MSFIQKNIKTVRKGITAFVFLLTIFLAPSSVFADLGTCKGERCICAETKDCSKVQCDVGCQGHNYGDYIKEPGTGKHYRYCSNCGDTATYKEDHSYNDKRNYTVTKEPTCTEAGSASMLCDKCPNVHNVTLKATGHSWGSYSKLNGTYHQRECSACGETEKKEHYTSSWSENNDTNHKGTCNECGVTIYENHNWGSWSKTSETTHTRKCNTCGATQEKSHDVSSWTDAGNGNHKGYCTTCKSNVEVAHNWNSWETTDTTHTRTCRTCTATESGGHVLTDVGIQISGEEKGLYHNCICRTCGKLVKEECGKYVDTSKNIVKSPTCTEPGTETATCNKCKASRTVTTRDALGHNMSGWKQTSDSHYKICERSGCSHRENQGSHSMGSWTYENESQCYQKCSVCSYKDPQSHTLGSWQTDGTYHWKVCSKCQRNIGKVAHAWSSWTQLDGDYCKRNCSICGKARKERSIKKF